MAERKRITIGNIVACIIEWKRIKCNLSLYLFSSQFSAIRGKGWKLKFIAQLANGLFLSIWSSSCSGQTIPSRRPIWISARGSSTQLEPVLLSTPTKCIIISLSEFIKIELMCRPSDPSTHLYRVLADLLTFGFGFSRAQLSIAVFALCS